MHPMRPLKWIAVFSLLAATLACSEDPPYCGSPNFTDTSGTYRKRIELTRSQFEKRIADYRAPRFGLRFSLDDDLGYTSNHYYYDGRERVWPLSDHEERLYFQVFYKNDPEAPKKAAVTVIGHAQERKGEDGDWEKTKHFCRAEPHFMRIAEDIHDHLAGRP